VETDKDFLVVLTTRDGTKRFVTDDELTVGVVRDLMQSGMADVRSAAPVAAPVHALAAGTDP